MATSAEISFPCLLPQTAFVAPGGAPTVITVTTPVVDAARCTFTCQNTGAVAVLSATMAFKVEPDDTVWGVDSAVPTFVLAPAATGAKTFQARVAAVRFTFTMVAPGGELTVSGRGGPASTMEDEGDGGGAELPDTPAAVLLDAANPGTILGLNASGEGESLDAAAARARIGAATAEVDPGMPSLGRLAYWNADDLSSYAPGAPLPLWEPTDGGGDLVAAGGERPTLLSTGSPKGGYAVEFNGTTNRMSWADPTGLPSGADAGTMVVIAWRFRRPVSTNGHVLHYGATFGDQTRGLIVRRAGWWGTHEWFTILTTEPLAWSATPHVLGHVYTGTELQLWVDGSPQAWLTVALNTVIGPTTAFTLGSRVDAGTEFEGFRVMEVAVFDHALVDAEWSQVMEHARIAHGVYP